MGSQHGGKKDSDGINRLKQGFAPFAIDSDDSLFELMADYLDYAAPTGNPTYLMSTVNKAMNIHNIIQT